MDSSDMDPHLMLNQYIYDYMVRNHRYVSAALFKEEAGITLELIGNEDSSQGLLPEWWSIFWDMYTGRQSRVGVLQDGNQDLSFNSNNQESCTSQVMEVGSSNKKPWLDSEQIQPNMNMMMMLPPFASSLNPFNYRNTLIPNNSQQINNGNHSVMNPFRGLKKEWLKQFNFPPSEIHDSTGLPANLSNGNVHLALTQQPQQMAIGPTSGNIELQGFHPPRPGNYLHTSDEDIFQSQAIISLTRPGIEDLLKLENRKNPWIVVLYAPSCSSCQALEVSYMALAEKLSASGIKVGKFQVHSDQISFAQQQLHLQSFPTIIFFSTFASQPIKYLSERRDVDSLLAFVNALGQ